MMTKLDESSEKDEYSENTSVRKLRNVKALNFFVAHQKKIAPNLNGCAKKGIVSARMMCVTAMMTVATVSTKETAVSW